jgi:protein TonB
LGALVWAAGSWVRLEPREEIVVVNLLEGAAAAQPAKPAPAAPEPPPAPEQPTPLPAPVQPPAPARPPRVAKPPRPAPVRAASRPAAPASDAAAPAPARENGGASGAASESAATPIDVARVYGEGEVDRVAAPLGGIRRPEYPSRERMMGREGNVSLLVQIDAGGSVREVTVARSAGAAFDSAARRAVERTPFQAARLAERSVASTVTVNVAFELE